jgi:mevalonate kinase
MYKINDWDIFIQRNKDRMDPDTLIGVFADKFNLDRIEAEEIVMRKLKKFNEQTNELSEEFVEAYKDLNRSLTIMEFETDDREIKQLIRKVDKGLKEIEEYIDRHYNWDV